MRTSPNIWRTTTILGTALSCAEAVPDHAAGGRSPAPSRSKHRGSTTGRSSLSPATARSPTDRFDADEQLITIFGHCRHPEAEQPQQDVLEICSVTNCQGFPRSLGRRTTTSMVGPPAAPVDTYRSPVSCSRNPSSLRRARWVATHLLLTRPRIVPVTQNGSNRRPRELRSRCHPRLSGTTRPTWVRTTSTDASGPTIARDRLP